MNPDIKDLRSIERYVVTEPLVGSFGAVAVSLLDIAEQGAQIEHPQPLRLGARGRLWFRRSDISASVHALVIWSRLSQTPNEEGITAHSRVHAAYHAKLGYEETILTAGLWCRRHACRRIATPAF